MAFTQEDVQAALGTVVDPNTGKDLVATRSVRNVRIDGADVSLDVELGYPARTQIEPMKKLVAAALKRLPGIGRINANVTSRIVSHAVQKGVKLIPNVKNIIAVASGIPILFTGSWRHCRVRSSRKRPNAC